MPLLSWVNLALYFLAFLFSYFIIKSDRFSRDIFVPVGLMFLFYTLFLPYVLMGEGYLISNNTLGWNYYKYLNLVNNFLFAFSIVYYAAKHALNPQRPWLLLTASALFVGVVFWHFFGQMLFQKGAIFSTHEYYKKAVTYFLLPPVAIFAYGLLYPLFRPNHGQYYHSLMIVFSLLSVREVFSHFTHMKDLFLFNLDLIFLTVTLVFLNIVLAKRLKFISSTTGQIYSEILNNQMVIPNLKLVGRDRSQYNNYLGVINYLYMHKLIIIPTIFISLLVLNFVNVPLTISMNLIALAIVAFLSVLFLMISYNNKIKHGGFIISPKGKKVN